MTEASTAFSQSRPVSLRLKLRVSHGLPHLLQGMINNGQSLHHGVHNLSQPFLAEFYSGSLPATLMMCFKIESAGAMPILGRDPLSNHQSIIYQSTSFIPPWHLPSRLFCHLLRWPAASCFPPKGKLLPLLPSAGLQLHRNNQHTD